MSKKQAFEQVFEGGVMTPEGYEIDQSGVYKIESDGSRVPILAVPLWVSGVHESKDGGGEYAVFEWVTPQGEHCKDTILLSVLSDSIATFKWLVLRGIYASIPASD
jgi:hypothetical protein